MGRDGGPQHRECPKKLDRKSYLIGWLHCFPSSPFLQELFRLLFCLLKTLAILQEEFLFSTGPDTDLLGDRSYSTLHPGAPPSLGAPLKFGSHFSYFRDGQGSEARGSAPQSNPWQTHPVKWQMPSHGSAAGETGFLHLPSLVEQEVFCPIRCSGWGDFGLQPFTFKGLCRENEPPTVAQEQTALWRWAEERVWEQAVPTSLANIPSPWTSKAEKNCAFKTKVDSFAYLS